jgi:hypothetical protein
MFNWLKRWRKPPAKRVGEERRGAERHVCVRTNNDRLLATIGTSGWPAAVRDLSATGVGIVVGVRQEPGTWLPVRLVHVGRDITCPMRAQVVHTERRPDGYWFSGCVFQGFLDEHELQELL